MPGYLGAAEDFRERYEIPIMRERNAAVAGAAGAGACAPSFCAASNAKWPPICRRKSSRLVSAN